MTDQVHEPVVLHPRWWYLVASAAFGAAVLLGVRAAFDVHLAGLEIVTILVPAVLWRMLRVTFADEGITDMRTTAPWADLDLRHIRFTGLCLTGPASAPRGKRVAVWPPMYESGWRTGRIGYLVHLHRPDLLKTLARSTS